MGEKLEPTGLVREKLAPELANGVAGMERNRRIGKFMKEKSVILGRSRLCNQTQWILI